MHPKIKILLNLLSVAVAVAGLIPSVRAEMPQRFAGSYVVKNVVPDGSQVNVTISLTVMNSTSKDIKGAIVALLDSRPESSLLGSFSAIKLLPHLGEATVSQTFTIPAVEYAGWQRGHEPVFQFLQSSEAGSTPVFIQARRVVAAGESTN